jgi:hypothetical protein
MILHFLKFVIGNSFAGDLSDPQRRRTIRPARSKALKPASHADQGARKVNVMKKLTLVATSVAPFAAVPAFAGDAIGFIETAAAPTAPFPRSHSAL